MKQEVLDDLLLDVVSVSKKMDYENGEAVFFLYLKDKEVKCSFCGTPINLINSFLTAMNSYGGLYDVLASASEAFEEDALLVIEEEE